MRCRSATTHPGPLPPEPDYRRAPGYPEHYRDHRFARGHGARTHGREAAILTALLARLPARPGRWLDIPAGAGRMSDLLPGPVVQVDRDAAMLAAAPARPGHARACASALALPFAADAFAGALCLRLLQHLPRREQRVRVLAELARVTAGPVLLSYFEARTVQHLRRWLRVRLRVRGSGRSAVSWRAFAAELAAAGLRPLARRPLAPWISEQTIVLVTRT